MKKASNKHREQKTKGRQKSCYRKIRNKKLLSSLLSFLSRVVLPGFCASGRNLPRRSGGRSDGVGTPLAAPGGGPRVVAQARCVVGLAAEGGVTDLRDHARSSLQRNKMVRICVHFLFGFLGVG